MDGMLIYNGSRPDIVYSNGELYGGLHCGDTFLCRLCNEWTPVRLEWMDDWTLWYKDHPYPIKYGLAVQI